MLCTDSRQIRTCEPLCECSHVQGVSVAFLSMPILCENLQDFMLKKGRAQFTVMKCCAAAHHRHPDRQSCCMWCLRTRRLAAAAAGTATPCLHQHCKHKAHCQSAAVTRVCRDLHPSAVCYVRLSLKLPATFPKAEEIGIILSLTAFNCSQTHSHDQHAGV